MLENLYTTKMSNSKEKLITRLENIQRQPKKKHSAVGILVFLLLTVALTVGTLCLAAAANQEAAPDVTMTDEELTAFLAQPWAPLDTPIPDLYLDTTMYMEQEFHRIYDPYYDIQELVLSNWQENGNSATFFYTMSYLHYNRDPSKVAYIQSIKDDPELYESLCKDYLALQTSNYAFKIIWEGDTPELYYEIDVEGGVDYYGPILLDEFVTS